MKRIYGKKEKHIFDGEGIMWGGLKIKDLDMYPRNKVFPSLFSRPKTKLCLTVGKSALLLGVGEKFVKKCNFLFFI